MNSKTHYTVTVGNIGTVYEGTSGRKAAECFDEYRAQSQDNYGRAAGEPVTIWKDGEPWREHAGADLETYDFYGVNTTNSFNTSKP